MSPCIWHQADSLTILNRSNTLPIYVQSKISYLEISRKYFFRRRQWSDKNISALEEFFDLESNAKYFKENKSIFVDLMHILHSALTQSGLKAKIVKRTNGGRTQRERERERRENPPVDRLLVVYTRYWPRWDQLVIRGDISVLI